MHKSVLDVSTSETVSEEECSVVETGSGQCTSPSPKRNGHEKVSTETMCVNVVVAYSKCVYIYYICV